MSLDPITSSLYDGDAAGLAVSDTGSRTSMAATQDLRLLFNNLPEAYILIGLDYNVQLFNKKARELIDGSFGLSISEGANLLHFAAEVKGAGHLLQILPKVLSGERITRVVQVPHADGDMVLQVQYNPAYDEQQQITGCIILIQNVTQSKKAEALVADNEQRWRFALEGANQGVWDWDMETGHVFYSEGWYRMLGHQPAEVGSDITDWEENIHPDDRELMRRHRVRHISGANPAYESEFRLRAHDGSYRWILSRGMIMQRATDGKAVRMIGTHTDITERKRMEEQYKMLFHKNPQPMWTFDGETLQFINVNEAAIRLYGYTQEEFQQMRITDIRPPEDIELLYQCIKDNGADGQFEQITSRHRHKDGKLISVHISGFNFMEDGRKITLTTAEDITGKIVAQERLIASEALYRNLFASIPLPAYIFDRDTLEILEINDTACSHYGYTANEFKRLSLLDLYVEEERESVVKAVAANKVLEGVAILNRIHRKKDGTTINVEVWISNVDIEGRPMRLVVVNDITEKLGAEAEIKASTERYKYVISATSDIVWDWHIGSKSVVWSDHYQHLTGWELPPSKELPLFHFVRQLHPQDRDRVLKDVRHLLLQTGDVLWENAFRYRRADGTYAHMLDKGFVIRNNKGAALRMIGVMHDISEQQYLQEVQELELRVFALSFRPAIKIQSVAEDLAKGLNHLYEQTFSSIACISGNGELTIAAPNLASDGVAWLASFVKSRRIFWDESFVDSSGIDSYPLPPAEASNINSWLNGRQVTHLVSLPVFGTEGNLMAVLLIFLDGRRDFTHVELNALHRMQSLLRILSIHHASVEQIRLANERFDNVIKATHDLIWDWNLETGSFYRSQEAIRRVFGIKPEKPIGNLHDWMGRIHPEDHAKVQQVIANILHAGTESTFDVEYRFLRDDGTYTFLYDRGIIIRNSEGKPVRMIGAAQDVSERKRLEQELLQQELGRQKMISQATIDTQEQERAEIGKELHDNVNQILTTTKLYLDLAQSSPDMKDELVAKASKNVIHVINEIRQLSRSLMDPSIGDLGLVDSIKDLAENINLTRKIGVKLSADEALNDLLDESKKLTVFRIVQEAMSNVIKHAQATEVRIKLAQTGKNVVLQIKDNGIGFNPGEVKSGIGLKNIRNRVYLANGELQVIAAPLKGCTLKIKFPLHKNPQ